MSSSFVTEKARLAKLFEATKSEADALAGLPKSVNETQSSLRGVSEQLSCAWPAFRQTGKRGRRPAFRPGDLEEADWQALQCAAGGSINAAASLPRNAQCDSSNGAPRP